MDHGKMMAANLRRASAKEVGELLRNAVEQVWSRLVPETDLGDLVAAGRDAYRTLSNALARGSSWAESEQAYEALQGARQQAGLDTVLLQYAFDVAHQRPAFVPIRMLDPEDATPWRVAVTIRGQTYASDRCHAEDAHGAGVASDAFRRLLVEGEGRAVYPDAPSWLFERVAREGEGWKRAPAAQPIAWEALAGAPEPAGIVARNDASLVRVPDWQAFVDWVKEGGYGEDCLDVNDSRCLALQDAYIEEAGVAAVMVAPAPALGARPG